MEIVLSKILLQIRNKEDKLSSQMMRQSKEALQMTLFLNGMLCSIKTKISQTRFIDEQQEIDFFKNIKPQILDKLIYYNRSFVSKLLVPTLRKKFNNSITAAFLGTPYW